MVDTYTITYADTSTSTFTVTNGLKGDPGNDWYVYIRYADEEPTRDADMKTTPSDWIGIYSGNSASAPTHYTSYTWYQYKGEKGDTGDASEVSDYEVKYQEGTSGTVAPTGTWSATIPEIEQGHYLWTRTIITFNDETEVMFYAVTYKGLDGSGAVSKVNNQNPDAGGNVTIAAQHILMQSGTESVEESVGNKLPKLSSGTTRKVYIHEGATQSDLDLSEIGTAFTITLSATWTNKAQTISDARFKAIGYAYEVAPSPSNFKEYGEAQIYADNVTTDGSMTFHCEETPSGALVVNVKRSVAE